MKLFKPWITIFESWGYANMVSFGREYKVASKTVVQVKQRRNGTYKVRNFIKDANNNMLADNLALDYVLMMCKEANDDRLRFALLDYNII